MSRSENHPGRVFLVLQPDSHYVLRFSRLDCHRFVCFFDEYPPDRVAQVEVLLSPTFDFFRSCHVLEMDMLALKLLRDSFWFVLWLALFYNLWGRTPILVPLQIFQVQKLGLASPVTHSWAVRSSSQALHLADTLGLYSEADCYDRFFIAWYELHSFKAKNTVHCVPACVITARSLSLSSSITYVFSPNYPASLS